MVAPDALDRVTDFVCEWRDLALRLQREKYEAGKPVEAPVIGAQDGASLRGAT